MHPPTPSGLPMRGSVHLFPKPPPPPPSPIFYRANPPSGRPQPAPKSWRAVMLLNESTPPWLPRMTRLLLVLLQMIVMGRARTGAERNRSREPPRAKTSSRSESLPILPSPNERAHPIYSFALKYPITFILPGYSNLLRKNKNLHLLLSLLVAPFALSAAAVIPVKAATVVTSVKTTTETTCVKTTTAAIPAKTTTAATPAKTTTSATPAKTTTTATPAKTTTATTPATTATTVAPSNTTAVVTLSKTTTATTPAKTTTAATTAKTTAATTATSKAATSTTSILGLPRRRPPRLTQLRRPELPPLRPLRVPLVRPPRLGGLGRGQVGSDRIGGGSGLTRCEGLGYPSVSLTRCASTATPTITSTAASTTTNAATTTSTNTATHTATTTDAVTTATSVATTISTATAATTDTANTTSTAAATTHATTAATTTSTAAVTTYATTAATTTSTAAATTHATTAATITSTTATTTTSTTAATTTATATASTPTTTTTSTSAKTTTSTATTTTPSTAGKTTTSTATTTTRSISTTATASVLLPNVTNVFTVGKGMQYASVQAAVNAVPADATVEQLINIRSTISGGEMLIAFFSNCTMNTIRSGGLVTAQGRETPSSPPLSPNTGGYVLSDCTLTAPAGVSGFYLGRPWGNAAFVMYVNTTIPASIAPAHWSAFGSNPIVDPAYAEVGSKGPGAKSDGSFKQAWTNVTAAEAAVNLTMSAILPNSSLWVQSPNRFL
ncbi:hypothetical protein BDK51DRAFT_34425 [Blyttiomyces helicus]|uniref:pectinesterase n=1 Tax=Blyttiomyces helicus TaxID=388810 RepID=A0A4P9WDW5_9FUNG|nr:hypothetical protein BDK51DRAFT_34425 [Blyttiomyces helicus]|eukprot:RKO89428.1 hypothetical protein BDK51DRAFT_34425 [Blyttiomyces helicus]